METHIIDDFDQLKTEAPRRDEQDPLVDPLFAPCQGVKMKTPAPQLNVENLRELVADASVVHRALFDAAQYRLVRSVAGGWEVSWHADRGAAVAASAGVDLALVYDPQGRLIFGARGIR